MSDPDPMAAFAEKFDGPALVHDTGWLPLGAPVARAVRRKLWHLRQGLRYRIPPCCILRFVLDPQGFPSGAARGGQYNRRTGGVFVPCGWLHAAVPDDDVRATAVWAEEEP